jgi:DNA-binding transcriptional MerR regulator
LLAGLAEITQHQEAGISITQIKEAMKEQMEEWEELLSSHWIGARLRTLDLIEKKTRYGGGRRYTIPHARVQDRQRRYQLL